jgi:hypothetical protein
MLANCDAFERQLDIMNGLWYYVKTIYDPFMPIVIS